MIDLQPYGVWKGQAQKREALAEKLEKNEAFVDRGPEQVLATLYEHFGNVSKNPGASLTCALDANVSKGGFWLGLYDDIVREKAAHQRDRGDDYGEAILADNEANRARDESALALHVVEKLMHERRGFRPKKPNEVADELKVKLERVPTLVRMGVAAKGFPDPDEGARMLLEGRIGDFTKWAIRARRKTA